PNRTLAYALKPAGAAGVPWYDGIIGEVAASTTLGPNNDYTIPHEIGHSLNLDHTWGGTNQPGAACGDDDVDDTPPTMGEFGCNLYDTTCNNVLVPIGKVIIDSSMLVTDSGTPATINITAKTGVTLTSLSIYPKSIGTGFDIALVKGTDTVQ